MKLYMIRHGETDWNKEKRMQGRTDTQLNEYGVSLAKITSEALKEVPFDIVYSSPLSRAVETTKILVRDRKIPVIQDERIIEMGFGEYEGRPPENRPPEFMYFFNEPLKYRPGKDGETYEQLVSRTGNFIKEVVLPFSEQHPEGCMLISSHGAAIKALLLHFKGIEINDIWSGPFLKNCAVSIVEINDGTFELIAENQIYYTE